MGLNSNGATDIESRWDFKLEAVLSGRQLRKSDLPFDVLRRAQFYLLASLGSMTQPTLRPDGTPVNLNSNGATDIESRWDFKLEAVLSGRVLRKSVLPFDVLRRAQFYLLASLAQ